MSTHYLARARNGEIKVNDRFTTESDWEAFELTRDGLFVQLAPEQNEKLAQLDRIYQDAYNAVLNNLQISLYLKVGP